MKPEHSRLSQLLADTISLLCKNSLKYSTDIRIEGVLGITVDTDQVFIVHIDDRLENGGPDDCTVKQENLQATSLCLTSSENSCLWKADAESGEYEDQEDSFDDVIITMNDYDHKIDNRTTFDNASFGKSKGVRNSSAGVKPHETYNWQQCDEWTPNQQQSTSNNQHNIHHNIVSCCMIIC